MLLFLPLVALEKSGCCNAVTEARLLPLFQSSAQNRKYAFHERGGWLNQHDVLCNIIPTRQLKPTIVMPELPQIVRACRAAVKTVVRGRASALTLLRRDPRACHRCKIARSGDRLRSCVPCALPFFRCSLGRVGAGAQVCVFMCPYV